MLFCSKLFFLPDYFPAWNGIMKKISSKITAHLKGLNTLICYQFYSTIPKMLAYHNALLIASWEYKTKPRDSYRIWNITWRVWDWVKHSHVEELGKWIPKVNLQRVINVYFLPRAKPTTKFSRYKLIK